ncbi:MAG: hypothetical protein ACE5HI_18750, partial [bacterium]
IVGQSKISPVLNYLKNQYKSGKRPKESDLINQFNEIDLASFIINTLSEQWEELDLKRWAVDCITAIKIENIQNKLHKIREDIRQAQNSNQPIKDLLQICMQLEEQKKNVQEESFLAES